MNTEYIKNLIMKVDEINRKKELKLDGGLKESKPRFKLIKKQGCTFCIQAVKLLKENKIEFDEKEKLLPEEEEIILKQRGKKYKYYPKIFELDDDKQTYNFLGGFNELKQKLNK